MTFDEAFDRLLGSEGGYVNHPADPGGETNWGISKRSYPAIDIKNLSRTQAKEIYRQDFWLAAGQGIAPAVAFQVFDAAVNHGISTAIRFLQRAVGAADDGHWGPNSQRQYLRADVNDVLVLFLAERLDFMRKLSTWSSFGSGWAGRIANDLRFVAKDN
jgi:lysozyme family protein